MIRYSKIGLGCVTFGREIDEETSYKVIDHAVAEGVTSFDTAAGYANGASETVIGNWIASRSPDLNSLTIATKIQPPYSSADISRNVDQSLERLGLNSIDLLYLHQWDESAARLDILGALDELVQAGTVRSLGVSNYSRPQLQKALELQRSHGLTPFSVIQNNFNYAVSDMDADFREYCKNQAVRVVTFSPLGAGFLTGKHKQGVESGSRFDVIPGHQDIYFTPESEEKLARLEMIAKRSGHSQTHLALAWAMHQNGIDSVLVGGRHTGHIDQAIAALNFDDAELFAEMDAFV